MPSFTPTTQPAAPTTFDLVKQFDAMRGGQQAPGVSTAAYAPPAPPTSPTAGGGGGSEYSAGVGGKYTASGKLVDYRGYKFDEAFAPFVQEITGKFGNLRIGSGYRDPSQNASANGVKNSHHLTGNAVDLSGSAEDMRAAAGYAQSKGYRVLIHNAGSGMHLHISR